jgi:3-phenylpropionate/trans-cinnamate dioxygenase ferredoxin reductase subunit
VIIGAGYIGLEIAASARSMGVEVCVLEALPRVLGRVAGAELSALVAGVHRAQGVDVRLNCVVAALHLSARGERVTHVECADGALLPADLVVVGIGVLPNTALAESAGLVIDNGIAVDEHAVTSIAGIVAAGDCTSHPSACYGRRIRLESVPNALGQARTAAATLCGKPRPYREVPWFWSDQYTLRLRLVGLLQGHDRCVLRGDPASQSCALFYLQGERILAVETVNRPAEFLLAKRMVAEGLTLSDAVLADDRRPLKDALP